MKNQKISISLKNNNEAEKETEQMLGRILNKYPLGKWIRCSNITIEQGASGKAFPFIILSTWRVDREEGLLAQFIHEQINWIEDGKEDKMNEAIEELKKIFPNAPVEKPEGGGSEKSTYKHLIVCRLEFLALVELLGEERARDIVLSNKNYTWIRKTAVESGPEIDLIAEKYFSDILC